jgi:hypothetical protein
LKFFQSIPDMPDDAKTITGHFLERVDTDFMLPDDVDLIQDARWLAYNLVLPHQW